MKKETIWEIQPHTIMKHMILKKYVEAWFPILSYNHEMMIYVDGFAGPGIYKNGEKGSPIVFLETITECSKKIENAGVMGIFIEKDKNRFEALQENIFEMGKIKNVSAYGINAEFHDEFPKIISEIEKQGSNDPILVFIDPFGYKGISMDMIRKIMRFPKGEVLINFMYEEINRFIELPNQKDNMNELFGDEKWIAICDLKDKEERENFIHELYMSNLKTIAGIKYVKSFKMINEANKTDYFLFFGTNHIKGLEKMKEAMWKVDKGSGFQFSDATYNPLQATLFEEEPDYDALLDMLLKKFRGIDASITEIENYIITDTPFLITHYKKKFKELEFATPPRLAVVECDKKRKRGTFSDRDMVIKLL